MNLNPKKQYIIFYLIQDHEWRLSSRQGLRNDTGIFANKDQTSCILLDRSFSIIEPADVLAALTPIKQSLIPFAVLAHTSALKEGNLVGLGLYNKCFLSIHFALPNREALRSQ